MRNLNYLLCIITVIAIAMICSACPIYMDKEDWGEEYDIEFVNETNETIYVSPWDTTGKDDFSMEDVFRLSNNEDFLMMTKIAPNSSHKLVSICDLLIEENWWYHVIVISQHTLDSYSKEEIIEKNIYDKKYVLRCSALERMNFKIVYTGRDHRDSER